MLGGQALLDEVAGAVMADDLERYLAHTAVPFVIVTRTKTFVLENREKLVHGFRSAVSMYRTLMVTDLIRLVKSERKIGSRLLSISFQTHVMRHGARVVAPFDSEAIARRDGDGWKVAMLSDSLTNEEWPIVVPRPEGAA